MLEWGLGLRIHRKTGIFANRPMLDNIFEYVDDYAALTQATAMG